MSSLNTISGFGKSTDNAFNLDVDHLQVNEGEDIYKRSDFYGPVTFHDTVTLDAQVIINADVEAKTFTATNATNQFVVRNASAFDFKVATSTTPVFNFRDQNNSLATSTIEANIINATQINNTQTTSATTSNSLVFSSQKNSGTSSGSSAGYVVQNSDNDSAGVYMQSTAGGKRGQIRSSSTAFGLDLQTDGYGTGANKSIKLYTDHTTINSALSVLSTSIFYDDITLTAGKSLLLNGSTSGTTTLKVPAAAGSYNFILPTTSGTKFQYLASGGLNNPVEWTTFTPTFTTPISSTLTAAYTTSTNILTLLEPFAANNTLQGITFGVAASLYNQAEIKFNYKNSGNDNNNITFGLNGSGVFRMYPALGIFEGPTFRIQGSTSGYIDLKAPAITSEYILRLPPTAGANGQVLTTNGSGTTSWVSPSITPTFTSLVLTSTDPALNSTTGALQVAGGISVNKKSYIAPSYSVPGSGVIPGITAGLVIDRPSFTSQNNISLEFGATVYIKGPPDYQANIQAPGEATAFSLVVEDVTQLDVLITTGAIACTGGLGVTGAAVFAGGLKNTGATQLFGSISQSLGNVTFAGPSLEGTFSSTMQLTSASNFSFQSNSSVLSSLIKSANKLNLEGSLEVIITSAKLTTTISGATNFTSGSTLYKTTSGNFEMESFGAGGFTSRNLLALESTTSNVTLKANNNIVMTADVGLTMQSASAMLIKSTFTMDILAIDDFTLTAGDATHQNSNISINTTLGAISLNCAGGSVSVGTTGGDIELDARNQAGTGGGEISLKANKLTTQIINALLFESTTSTLTLKTTNQLLKLESNGGAMTFDSTLLADKGKILMKSGDFEVNSTGTITLESTGQQYFKTTTANFSPMNFITSGSNMLFDTNGGMYQLNLTTSPTTGGKFDVNCDTCEIQTNNGFKSTVSLGNYDALVTSGDMDITVSSGKLDITTTLGALGITASAGALNLTATAGTANLNGAIVSIQALVGTATMSGLASVSMTSVGTASMTGAVSATVTSAGAATLTGAVTATLSSAGVATVNGGATLALTGGGATTMTSVGLMTITGGAGLSMTVPTGAMLLSVPLGAATVTVGAGLLAISAAIGGMTFTTGIGLMQFTGAAGGIAMNTAAGDITIAAGILPLIPVPFIGNLNLFAGLSNVNIKSSAGAINIIAKAGGVNIGCTSETDTTSQIGHFSVKTINGFSAAETGNISLLTFDDGLFDGPGNIELSTFSAQVGNITLQSKGNLKIVSQNSNPIYLNTSGVTQSGGYTWKYPATSGSAGQLLSSNGDGNTLLWTNPYVQTPSYFELTAGTYDMNNTSPFYTNVTVSTGGAVQIKLPDATTLTVGSQYVFNCNGSTPTNVKTFTNSSVVNLQPGSVATLLLTSIATSTGVWDWHEQLPTNTKWSAAALTTPTRITTENTTDATAVNTGSLITLGGAAISKKLFVGDLINLGGAATANNSIVLQNTSSGTVNNSLSIGTTGSPTVFKFFPFYGILEGPIFRLLGSTSGQINLQCPATTTGYSLTFPSSAGSANQVLTTNGSGVTSWTTPTPQSSAFTTPVTITVASGTITTPALQVALTNADTSNFYATFLNGAAPDNSTHTLCIGKNVLECAYLRYTYVSAASALNYYSIGNDAAQTAFKFYPVTSKFTLSGSIESTLPSSSTTSTTMLSLLQPSAVNAGTQSIALGVATSTNNQGIIQFNYAGAGNGNNAIGFGSPGNLNKMKFFTSLGLLETNTFRLLGTTSGNIDLKCPATTSGYSLTFPSTAGSANQVLTTNGSGVTSWTTPAPQSSAFTTAVTIDITSATSIVTPALGVSLTGANTENFYATFLSNASPGNSNHTICLGHDVLDCAYLRYKYVSAASTANYFSIGNSAAVEAFKFYPIAGESIFDCQKININGSSIVTPVLMVTNTATATSTLAHFLQASAADNTSQTLVLGKNVNLRNSVALKYTYAFNNSGNNSLDISFGNATPEVTFTSLRTNIKNQLFLNHNQGVTSGLSALVISPSTTNGDATLSFTSDVNNTGNNWKIGHNIQGLGANLLCFYSSLYGISGFMNNNGELSMTGGFVAPNLGSSANLEIQASNGTNRKINIHCGSTQSGGIYLNSTSLVSDSVAYGSTNIGHPNLGNSLFVGCNQERYISAGVSANGIVNICESYTNSQFVTFYSKAGLVVPNNAVGSITFNGATTNYNSTSDYRVKENIEEMTEGLSLITLLRPVTYNMTYNPGTRQHGFIAHEVQEIYPEAVTGEKDAVDEYGKPSLQQLSLTNLIPVLTKGIQELHQLLLTQQQTIAELTARLLIVEQK